MLVALNAAPAKIAPVAGLLIVKLLDPKIKRPLVRFKKPVDAREREACKVTCPELLMIRLKGPDTDGNSASVVVKPVVPL